MANLHDRYGRPLGPHTARKRRRAPTIRPPAASAPPNPRTGAGRDRSRYEVHEEDYEHGEGFAGIPEHGGGGTVIVQAPAPRKEKFAWLKLIATGLASAVGGIIAYRAYDAAFGKGKEQAAANPAPAPTPMVSGPQLAAAHLLSQPASPSVNQALALQALASLQAQQQLPDPQPVRRNPAEDDEELSYMDRYLQQLEEEE